MKPQAMVLGIAKRKKTPLLHYFHRTFGCAFKSNSHDVYRGFTLVELLVVMAIISLLAAMLLPVLGQALDAARCAQCLSNVKNFMSGTIQLINDHDGYIPGHDWQTGEYGISPTVQGQRDKKIVGDYYTDWVHRDFLRNRYATKDALMCPTLPNISYFRYMVSGPTRDRNCPSPGQENWRGFWFNNHPWDVQNEYTPMGSYYYRGGFIIYPRYPPEIRPYTYYRQNPSDLLTDDYRQFTLKTNHVVGPSRYAVIWDYDELRGLAEGRSPATLAALNPHFRNPGRSFGFFDGHVKFVKRSLPWGVDDVRYVTPVLQMHGGCYYYKDGQFGPSEVTGAGAEVPQILIVPRLP
ncbi:MAG: type II secretion system GspH family protein [Planctomycetota bacterium]|nr:type II secretion system GspH family protein [Planctomycetota bacterium]